MIKLLDDQAVFPPDAPFYSHSAPLSTCAPRQTGFLFKSGETAMGRSTRDLAALRLPPERIEPPRPLQPMEKIGQETASLASTHVASNELVFEFTRDPDLLRGYFEVYESQFASIYDAHSFRVIADDYDKTGYTLIVRHNDMCVGGARLCTRTARRPHPLPMETDGFRLDHAFPELRHDEMSYGQMSRLALRPEFCGGDVTRQVFRHLYRKVVALSLDKVFAASPLANARLYRRNCIMMGLKNVIIHPEVALPQCSSYNGIRPYLVSGVVQRAA